MSKKIGLVLGGLGGFNSISAAFLQAVVDRNVKFDAISCTSGAILTVSQMLQQKSLRDYIKDLAEVTHPIPEKWISTAKKYDASEMVKMANFFAFLEKSHWKWRKPNFLDFQKKYIEKSSHLMTAAMNGKLNFDIMLDTYFDLVAPAQKLIPSQDTDGLNALFQIIQNAQIPILLNSLDLRSGKDIVHINKNGQNKKIEGMKVIDLVKANTFCKVEDLKMSDVLTALWLYQFGFKDKNNKDMDIIDGAYHRQFIMKELAWCDKLVVVRPQEANWVGPLPDNEIAVQDFMIETWFNSAFTAELSHIKTINKHIKEKRLLESIEYNHTDIEIFSTKAQFSSFEYFVESLELFDETYEKACDFLDELKI